MLGAIEEESWEAGRGKDEVHLKAKKQGMGMLEASG